MRRLLAISIAVAVVTTVTQAAAQERDFLSPERRILADTAYTLQPGQWQVEGSVFGAGESELFMKIGGAVGLGAGFDLSLNLAHYTVGLINTVLTWNIVDEPHFGLGLEVGFTWGNGKWMWIMPSAYKEVLNGINLYIIPVTAWTSYPVNDWLQFDLGVGYNHAEIVGDLDDETFLDGSLGRSELVVTPAVRFYVLDRLALSLTSRIPLWSRTGANLTAATTIVDGAYIGVRTSSREDVPFNDAFSVTFTAESPVTDVLNIALRVTWSNIAEQLYKTPVAPSLSLQARW